MSRRTLAALILGCFLSASPASADLLKQDDYVHLVEALTDKVVIPGYERYAIETSLLGETLRAYCGHPTEAGAHAVVERYHDTMDAWARVQPILFGPVMNAPGSARFQFWPDKRGTGQRQMRQVLNAEDPDVLTPSSLDGKSIALGDLQALEYVLFDDPRAVAVPGGFRCRYALSIADLQRTRAALLLQGWTGPNGFRAEAVGAAAGTAAFFDEREAAGAFLNSLVGALEIIRLQKLDRPMGLTIDDARGKRAENWRSRRSLRNIRLNLETLHAFFATPHGFADLLAKAGSDADAIAAQRLIGSMLDDMARFDRPLAELVADPDARPDLEALLTELRDLQSLVQDRVAANLGLVPGFNATDGD